MAKKKTDSPAPLDPKDIEELRQELLEKLGAKVSLGEDIKDSDLQSISTGSLKLDWALGTPFVEGSMNEIYGSNQTGKSTLALEVSANAIKLGKPVFFFDMERKLRESQLDMIKGLSAEARKLFVRIRPDTGEEAADLIYDCIMDFPGCLIVFDSVSAMMPEIEGAESASKEMMGKVAKLCWKIVRKCLGPAERNKATLLFLSHISPKLNPYQSGDLVKGGRAIADLSAQRVKLKRLGSDILKDKSGNLYGQMTQCEVVKNNMARPFRKVSVPIIWGKGIDRCLDLVQLARDLCVIDYQSKGGRYTYVFDDCPDGKKLFESQICEIIRTNSDYRNHILEKVAEVLGN